MSRADGVSPNQVDGRFASTRWSSDTCQHGFHQQPVAIPENQSLGPDSPASMQVVILGNAGSGKSPLAHWLAERGKAEQLDLGTVAWEPGQAAVARDPALAQAEVERFCRSHAHWVVEGC
jgi:hypothetical protein